MESFKEGGVMNPTEGETIEKLEHISNISLGLRRAFAENLIMQFLLQSGFGQIVAKWGEVIKEGVEEVEQEIKSNYAYRIVQEESLVSLETKVEQLLNCGWSLAGGVAIHKMVSINYNNNEVSKITTFIQALVRKEGKNAT
jgi:hypothetical protein